MVFPWFSHKTTWFSHGFPIKFGGRIRPLRAERRPGAAEAGDRQLSKAGVMVPVELGRSFGEILWDYGGLIVV